MVKQLRWKEGINLKIIIDRFEADFAVVEMSDRKMVNMPRVLLPETAKEGDVIEISINNSDTQTKKKEIRSLMENVFE